MTNRGLLSALKYLLGQTTPTPQLDNPDEPWGDMNWPPSVIHIEDDDYQLPDDLADNEDEDEIN